MFTQTYHWDKWSSNVVLSMDQVREQLNRGGACFDGTESRLKQDNKFNLRNAYRSMGCSFVQKVVHLSRKIDDGIASASLGGEETSDPQARVFTGEQERLLSNVLDRLHPWDKISYEWLVAAFHVSLQSVRDMKHAEMNYCSETSTSEVKTVLNRIAHKQYYDFTVLKSFFQKLYMRQSIVVYTLPKHMVEEQVRTLHRIYQTLPGEELHPSAGLYYICINCQDFKADLAEPAPRRPLSRHAMGVFGVRHDPSSGELYCQKQTSILEEAEASQAHPAASLAADIASMQSTDALGDLGYFDVDFKRENKKVVRERRKRDQHLQCTQIPLTPINMVGVLLQFFGQLILLCPKCGAPTTYHRKKITVYQFSCGQCMYSASPPPVPVRTPPDAVRHECCFCHAMVPEHKITYHRIWDDVTDPSHKQLVSRGFCSKHNRMWINEHGTVERLKFIFYAIENHIRSIRFDGGRMLFNSATVTTGGDEVEEARKQRKAAQRRLLRRRRRLPKKQTAPAAAPVKQEHER